MVNLKAKPFYLSDEDIIWVKNTINDMTLEEKIEQLFIQYYVQEGDALRQEISRWQPGGMRYLSNNSSRCYEDLSIFNDSCKIPPLVSANCDNGGDGACKDGVYVASAAACAAAKGTEVAYHMGYVAGKESAAIGNNWMFNPCCDIYYNWRNTIVNTRCFGDNADRVLENVRAFIRGIHESNIAACAKHFPGDGVEERDQHLVMGVNDLSVEEWNASYRKVYQGIIDDGLESLMVGHIALPEMTRKLRPGIADRDIMPATVAPELLNDLLRGEMNFNGLIITDASEMIGVSSILPRRQTVVDFINAGCDMILYANNMEEDLEYLKKAMKEGRITEERLQDALERILGLKAHLKLHEKQKSGSLMPSRDRLTEVACEEHKRLATDAKDKAITLVKNTDRLLPINPATQNKVMLYYIDYSQMEYPFKASPVRQMIKEELEAAGFEVTIAPNYYDRYEEFGNRFAAEEAMEPRGKMEEYREKYDLAFIFINERSYAQENKVGIRWSCNHSNEVPWYACEVPTIGVSLNYTNHLFDVPMLRTFVNAYNDDRETVRMTIEKLCGKGSFRGTPSDTVFCGKWDTRL